MRLEALHHHPTAFSSDYFLNEAKPSADGIERLRFKQGESTGVIYFAIHSERLVGMTGIQLGNSPKTRHTAFIWGVYVQPQWRGFHLAEGLMTACLDWARLQGVRIVRLAVVTSNTSAIRCYARLGFSAYGVEPQALYYEGTFYDELLRCRNL